MTDPLTAAAQHGEMRRAALIDLLRGRRRSEVTPARSTSGSFDRGCRTPVPLYADPLRSHDLQLLELLRTRAADAGGRF